MVIKCFVFPEGSYCPILIISLLITFLATTTEAENSSLTASNGVTHCTDFTAWLSPGFTKTDCHEASDRLEYSDYAIYSAKSLEFHDRGTRRTSELPQIFTPRKYTISTCTVVVAMLWSFPVEPPLPRLPGPLRPHGPYGQNTIVSFRNIYRAVERIQIHCLGSQVTPVGWESLGNDGSVGVFVMATDSLLARNLFAVNDGATKAGYLLDIHGNSTAVTS